MERGKISQKKEENVEAARIVVKFKGFHWDGDGIIFE